MILDQITNSGRRHFIKLMSSISAGFFMADGKRVLAAKKDIKQIVEGIEAEKIIQSHPKRHPEIHWKQIGDCAVLSQKGKEDPFFRLNRTGTIIWKACNGKYSPSDLAQILHRTFQIDAHQAHIDCICFLAALNSKGAILL